MLYRTLTEARNHPHPMASWKTNVIERVSMGGVELFRVTVHDQYHNRCKRCKGNERGRYRGVHAKIPSTGHTCDRCLNPFAGFVRMTRRRGVNGWESIRGSFSGSGIL